MINSNHFDAGYADQTHVVVNEYFDTYFPRAAKVGADLRVANGTGAGPLQWMTFAWLISLYFDCPADLGLHCPSPEAKGVVEAAIKAKDIVWPAFPHNAELATGDASMLKYGVDLTQQLAKRFGVATPTVLSTRDVPGMPRAALHLLAEAGVTALSEGMNGRMVPVNVPPAFRWQSQDGDVIMPTMWHWGGYGQLSEAGDPIRIPGSKHALAYCWRGDNAGPPESAREVLSNAVLLQKKFENSTSHTWTHNNINRTVVVVSSSFDEFVAAVKAETDSTGALPWEELPLITEDLADTWICGVGSDPVKVQRMRAIHRARVACEAKGECGAQDTAYQDFSRLALKNIEHTWGISVSHFGPLADTAWSNTDFHAALEQNESHLSAFEASWQEQRDWGVNTPLSRLPDSHPVRMSVERELIELTVTGRPDLSGYTAVSPATAAIAELGGWGNVSVGVGGALVQLDAPESQGWASADNPLGLLQYQTLVLEDFEAWQAEYLIAGTGGQNEYGKPPSFMKARPTPEHQLVAGSLEGVWRTHDSVMAHVSFNESLWTVYGSPQEAWIQYNFDPATRDVNVTLTLLNKTATRLPEAAYFGFKPSGSASGTWAHHVLGEWASPLDVADGAARGLHFTSEEGVRMQRRDGMLQVRSYDMGLLRWDKPLPFPTPLHREVDLGQGAAFCLLNQIWNTNYPMWLPFGADGLGKHLRYRFQLSLN
eukprot:TRINITY_DN10457_c0_g1_i2.p1 TRINITY_DN10457_c0_g1~~TRINITY_DN10457_c0_g1_i2.p1  ORF type:complete len:711 (+),score=130.56 TRINITY_DN10457_c0_g1_i2:283-2415(+)